VHDYMGALNDNQKRLLPVGDLERSVNAIINKSTLVCQSNVDRRVYVSSYVDPFIAVTTKFNLSTQQTIELAISVGWTTEGYKYPCVLMSWVKANKLPSGNLTIAFANNALLLFDGLNCGPRNCFQPKIKKNHLALITSMKVQ
jgi:hypothetical protein